MIMFSSNAVHTWLILLGVFALAKSFQIIEGENLDPLSDEFIRLINSKATTWKAGRNFNKEMTERSLRTIGRVRSIKYYLSEGKRRKLQPLVQDQRSRRNFDRNVPDYVKNLVWYYPDYQTHKFDPLDQSKMGFDKIPDEFDSRAQWPDCPSIKEIRTQGCCGDCWLIAPVEVMTDRVCIHSNASKQFHFSVEDILTCYDPHSRGCNGDFVDEAWLYWVNKGVVSGGPHNSKEGCRPYSIRPSCPGAIINNTFWTPPCNRFCQNEYNKTYQEDKHYGKKVYYIQGGEKSIQQEIMDNGPVTAVFQVYADFIHYRTGVYKHVSGTYLGTHAVKIIGWGIENGTIPFWIVANSAGPEWGENGFFKILRGSNECEIETHDITAGIPNL